MNAEDAYAYAWDHADRNLDGLRIESSIVNLIAANIDYDADQAKRGLAQRILARRKRSGQTVGNGAVVFPGMEHYGYEPHRLLVDDDGNVIENQYATARVKNAEADRAEAAWRKAATHAGRERMEANAMTLFASQETGKGRDPSEITWGACVTETGLWKDAAPGA